MKNSRKFYAKSFMTYGGIILMLIAGFCTVISSLSIENSEDAGKLILVFICLGIVGLVLFIISGNFNMLFSLYRNHGGKISLMYDYKNVGVPNNIYDDFKIEYTDIVKEDIKLKEITKGIYEGTINEKVIVMDMNGWLNRKYYLYEYFLSIIQLKLVKNEKTQLSKSQKCNIQELNLYIEELSGKKYMQLLVANHMTQLTLKFKERIKIKSSQVFEKKISISSLYNFNIK